MMRNNFWKGGAALAFAALLSVGMTACRSEGSKACAHGETETVTLIEATCTEDGKTKTVCKDCKVILSETEVKALGHDFGEWRETSEASCSSYGVLERTCARGCKEYDSVDKLTHTTGEDGKCTVCTQTVYSLGLKYTLSDDGEYYSVALGGATDEDIVIPAVWENKPVREIAAEGFAYSNRMKSVTVPESVEKISSGAFNGSNALTTVYWNARACADFADRNWAFLRSDTAAELHVVFGRNVERIPARMFFPLYNDTSRVPNVTEVTFEEGSKLQSVGDYAFYRTPISEISLPEGLKSIGEYAFAHTGLTSVRAVGLSEVGDFAFCNNKELVSVELGGDVDSFGTNVFDYCIGLQTADFSKLRGRLGASLFKNCYELTSATFAEGVTGIPERAFYGCKRLQSAELPDSVLEIGAETFVGCENVRSITIGKSVEKIGNDAFSGLVNVTEVYYNAVSVADFGNGNGVFLSLGKNTVGVRFVLGEEVTRLPARFFFPSADSGELPNISEIGLNSALSVIGEYAFFGADCTVSYAGTQTQWQAVTVGDCNDGLANVMCKGGN